MGYGSAMRKHYRWTRDRVDCRPSESRAATVPGTFPTKYTGTFHWVVIAYVCICTFLFIYVDCNCILYLRVCMPDIFRYGMCIKTTGCPLRDERVRQRSDGDRGPSCERAFALSIALDTLRESTFRFNFSDTACL